MQLHSSHFTQKNMYPLEYYCNGLATHSVEQFYLNSIVSCLFMFLFITPIFMKFQRTILEKTLYILQYFQHIRNICIVFKKYYDFYQQLQHLCRDTSPKELSSDYVKFKQIEPPSEEYTEVRQQIQ